MSDQYIPPRSGAAAAPYGESTRTNIHIATPRTTAPRDPVVKSEGGGFASGLLVAAVFAVIALLAFALLGGDGANTAPEPSVPVEAPGDPIPDASPADPVPDAIPADPVVPVPADPVVPVPADPDLPAPQAAPQPANP